MQVAGVHHVAYRCNDTQETIDFYRHNLGMDLILAISEDRVPSTKAPDPYMHIFLDAGGGNILAFFELPNSPQMGRDPHTPDWVQHIALKVKDLDTLQAYQDRLTANGVEVLGPTNHEIFQSIYFRDPNGHRIELAADTVTPDVIAKLHALAPEMIAAWNASKKTVKHAAWLHSKEFAEG